MTHTQNFRFFMTHRVLFTVFLAAFSLTACAPTRNEHRISPAESHADAHVPDFATRPFEPFNRQDVVALAMREWRLFGSPIDDSDPEQRPPPQSAALKPERAPGLWQRVGEYWWIGMNPNSKTVSWTGKHDANGQLTDFTHDGHYAWSAAFVSYIMRIAGAGNRFPYSPNHSTYINAAASGESPILQARDPATYAPQPGDLLCTARGQGKYNIRFTSLPTSYHFPAHCGYVVATGQNAPPFGHEISIIGGNVDDSVALTHVPTDAKGMIASPDGHVYDSRYPWCVILQVLDDAEREPDAGD